ncbi:MAG: PD-(D/E)XK nuclease family protein [Erythrobacter sp.]
MGERGRPEVYSIAAHRGFADALVAGLVPRYAEPGFGLARLTLLLPSSRAARSLSEAFIRHAGETGAQGLLMPRMVMVGDTGLDEALGSLLDPLGSDSIPPAADPVRRWFELAGLLRLAMEREGRTVPASAALLQLARDLAATMDRLLAEEVEPEDLLDDAILGESRNLAEHWQANIKLFAIVQQLWRARLEERGEVDLATRRNLLFERAATRWRNEPPPTPVIAAGVASAAPALARLLRVISELPQGAIVLPDLDLARDEAAWHELGLAGQAPEPGAPPFSRAEAATHPQYHLKLLLNRMGIARAEVRPWHRRGLAAAAPERSQAISSLFLPPEASRVWASLDSDKRRLSGLRMLTCATSEEEAQAIALLIREALEEPAKRIALVTPDRTLARRVVQHLDRWDIAADDTAGRPLSLTAAGRMLLQLALLGSEGLAPIPLVSALGHPLVRRGEGRREWLEALRAFERRLRGPRPAPGPEPLREVARRAGVADWWGEVEALLGPLVALGPETGEAPLAEALDALAEVGTALAGDDLWAQEDGRELARLVEELRLNARETGLMVTLRELHPVLRGAMDLVAVRPPYGGHPRVAIYGLLESRMARADLVICGALNEGTWPQAPAPEPLLAPAIQRALGMPGPEFRIGLAAHDLASALGAPEVVLTRALRDMSGPTIPSRFLLRIEALLGDSANDHRETRIPELAARLDRLVQRAEPYPRPEPSPSAELRVVPIKVTGLDRLLGDPYQFYAQEVLRLSKLDPLDADPARDFAWQGTLVHEILHRWHRQRTPHGHPPLLPIANEVLQEANLHPLLKGLWRPRLYDGLAWIERCVAEDVERTVVASESKGHMIVDGVTVHGRADRIDRLADGTLAIVDYKTGEPPSAVQVAKGYALQLGTLGLIAQNGSFEGLSGEPTRFEHWSLGRNDDGGFGYIDAPMKEGRKTSGLLPEEFLPAHERHLHDAIRRFIKGDEPFTAKLNPDYPGYTDYDQLMRLAEWRASMADDDGTDGGDAS